MVFFFLATLLSLILQSDTLSMSFVCQTPLREGITPRSEHYHPLSPLLSLSTLSRFACGLKVASSAPPSPPPPHSHIPGTWMRARMGSASRSCRGGTGAPGSPNMARSISARWGRAHPGTLAPDYISSLRRRSGRDQKLWAGQGVFCRDSEPRFQVCVRVKKEGGRCAQELFCAFFL